MIEELLADTEPAARERITAAYPDYPDPSACIQLGGDFAFSSAAWQIAEAHSKHAPTYLYRYDYAPRTLRWSGLGATHATELFAVFDIYRTRFGALLTAVADRRLRCGSATKCNDAGGRSAAPVCRATTGPPTPSPNVRSWCSTASPASSSIRTRTAGWRGTASPWHADAHGPRL